MLIPQLSVFVEDKVGRVADLCDSLAEARVNILAFDIADTAEGFGILRLVVDDCPAATAALRAARATVTETRVVGVHLTHTAGALARILRVLSERELNVEFSYVGANNNVFLSTSDNAKAADALEAAGQTLIRSLAVA